MGKRVSLGLWCVNGRLLVCRVGMLFTVSYGAVFVTVVKEIVAHICLLTECFPARYTFSERGVKQRAVLMSYLNSFRAVQNLLN